MEQRPKVSVAIITSNRLSYLPTAIDSVFAQEDFLHELLVVDDGSTDGTLDYLKNIAHEKLRTLRHESNEGRPAARNSAVRNFSGDFLLWLDDDDALLPDAIKSQLDCAAAHPDAQIIYANLQCCNERMKPGYKAFNEGYPAEEILLRLLYRTNFPNGGTMIHRSVFEKVGFYSNGKARSEDYEFWARAAIARCKFQHNNNFIYLYRQHPGNRANPEIAECYKKYRAEIMEYILAHESLENIFPMLDWRNSPADSVSAAMLYVARIFFEDGNFARALQSLEKAWAVNPAAKIGAMKLLLRKAMGESETAADESAAIAALENTDASYLCKPPPAVRTPFEEVRKILDSGIAKR